MAGQMRRALLGAAVLASAACGDSTGPDDSPFGTYILRTIATLPMPFVITDFGNGETEEVTGGSIVLNADQTFSQAIGSRSTFGGTITDEVSTLDGDFTLTGEAITLVYSTSQEDAQGSLSGDTLTLQIQQIPWVFVRSSSN